MVGCATRLSAATQTVALGDAVRKDGGGEEKGRAVHYCKLVQTSRLSQLLRSEKQVKQGRQLDGLDSGGRKSA